MPINRRNFLQQSTLGVFAAVSIPGIVSAAYETEKISKITVKEGDIILLQGDSITDAGRDKNDMEANKTKALGTGYAFMATSEMLYKYAGKNLQLYNRGISGNKVYQLAERWKTDCLALRPNILSILIGVNDFWHTLGGKYTGTVKTYADDLTALLDRTKQSLPDTKLVIGEPFAIPGVKAVDEKWFPAFYDYQKSAREIAAKFDASFIPYQAIFEKAIKSAPAAYWTGDGVHTSIAGARLMAEAWVNVFK